MSASPILTDGTSATHCPTPKVRFPTERTRVPLDAAKLQAGNFGDGKLVLKGDEGQGGCVGAWCGAGWGWLCQGVTSEEAHDDGCGR